MKVLVPLIASVSVALAATAFADDKTTPQSVDQRKLKEERAKADKAGQAADGAPSDPYGTSPTRTQRGTPLVGDFNEKRRSKGQAAGKDQPKALPLKGGFGPVEGRAEGDARKQREQAEREQSIKAWDKKYGPDDPPKN